MDYDSVIDALCADDNATAVAVALAAAETFRDEPLRRAVLIALFDAEEPRFFSKPDDGLESALRVLRTGRALSHAT